MKTVKDYLSNYDDEHINYDETVRELTVFEYEMCTMRRERKILLKMLGR